MLEQLITLALDSGRAGLDMGLYILMPIMVIMLAIMKLLDAKGILSWVANKLAPITRIFGIPGLGVFAMIKILFVGFAAPIATFVIMDKGNTSRRYIASTLAMVMTMSQANASLPLTTVGLNLHVALLTSICAGLAAAAFTYYILCRNFENEENLTIEVKGSAAEEKNKTIFQILSDGGQEGLKIVFSMIPMLILALFVVNILKTSGAITSITHLLASPLSVLGLSESTILPIITKFIAGGTAFTGITLDLINQGAMSPLELNRIAGFTINSLDIVGVTVYAAIGKRLGGVIRFAIYGALFGIFLRGVAHLIIF
ncbi:MAG: nucleoside recognition family protein [Cycloclasticus sp. symbiont of Bathymodiolus heckerae]|nr:MAG: nucleoside recognition family protein [Cycloclasticus sp. symbiont of Bathymodiolus heckerae]